MASSAAYLSQAAQQTVTELDEVCRAKYAAISGKAHTSLKLVYKGNLSEDLMERYARMRAREMAVGYTLLGPHRDDVQILLDGKEARLFASEGQQRACCGCHAPCGMGSSASDRGRDASHAHG